MADYEVYDKLTFKSLVTNDIVFTQTTITKEYHRLGDSDDRSRFLTLGTARWLFG